MDFKSYRLSLGKNQKEMAELLGCSQSHLAAIEAGRRGITSVMRQTLVDNCYSLLKLDYEASQGCASKPVDGYKDIAQKLLRFRKDNTLSVEMMSELLETSPLYYTQIEEARRPLSDSKLANLMALPNYNMDAFRKQPAPTVATIAQPYAAKDVRFVPLLNLDAKAGFSANDAVDCAEQLVAFAGAIESDFAITVAGDSMSPTYPPGTIILLREVGSWRDYLDRGVYVIELNDYRRIFKLFTGIANGKLCIKSINPEYGEAQIPMDLINRIYIVKAAYKRITL